MSLERFKICLPLILADEGGYVDDPRDPGGATKLGVTLATARAYRLDMDHDGDVDKADVKALTPEAVAPVYHRGYWLASSADICPSGLDYAVFDCAVNQGVGRAVRWLQEVAGVRVDGIIGPMSIRAIQNVARPLALAHFMDLRRSHYRSLSTFDRFGRGWMARCDRVEGKAMSMIKL